MTDSDEDAAHARLKHYLYGTPIRAEPSSASAPLDLSQDAAIVRYVHTQLARAGWQPANALNRVGEFTDVGDALDSLGVCTAEEDSLA